MNKKIKFRSIFEFFIITAILLVIVQTFLDEYSRYAHWSVQIRNILLFSGFAFDLIFSIEFTLRTIWSKKEKGFVHYFIHERGWIDLLASYPLLLLDSGPSAYLLLFGHLHQSPSALEVINIFKVIKAIRVTRILRLIRIVKIFGKIQNAESKMAQHHTAEISTIAVFTVICVLLGFSIFNVRSGFSLTDQRNEHYKTSLSSTIEIAARTPDPHESIIQMFENDKNVLLIIKDNQAVHQKLEKSKFEQMYDTEDYSVINAGKYTLYISHIDITRQTALDHIQSLFMIVFLVLAFMIIYTRHFVQKITDVIHIIDMGWRKRDYNLQVKIKPDFADHEIFKMAEFYNEKYLPEKMKKFQKIDAPVKSGLSMNDILKFNAPDDDKKP
jgi:hypothetical protein